MRLPWLQVNADGITRARAFGRLYGIGEDAGVGVVMRLWAWALELSPDGDFSGTVTDARGLAAGCGLDPSDSARVVSELQRVGLVATAPTLRVRGLDRYAPAWRKNRKPHGTSAGSDANQRGFTEKPKRKTETDTKTETETPQKLAGKKPPAPPKPPKPVEPPDPRHAPLVKALVDAAPGYAFAGGRDAKAVSALLTLGEPDEVVRRWLRAWGRTGYPTVRTLSELVTHWNHFATAGPAVASAPLEQHTKTGRLEL